MSSVFRRTAALRTPRFQLYGTSRERVRCCPLPAAYRIIAATPDIGLRELTRHIAMATRHRISESTTAKLRDELRAQTSHDTDDIDKEQRNSSGRLAKQA